MSCRTCCGSLEAAVAGAGGVFLAGILSLLSFIWVTKVVGFKHLVAMVEAESGNIMRPLLISMFMLGICTCLFGLVGYFALRKESRGGMCVYFLALLALAWAYVGMIIVCLELDTTVVPVIERQVAEFCNATLQEVYAAQLGCRMHPSLDAEELRGQCGSSCEQRIELIREMGGCDFLHGACSQFIYADMGQGFCVTNLHGIPAVPPMIRTAQGALVSLECCREACDSVVRCNGFVAEVDKASCHLISPHGPAPSEAHDVESGERSACPTVTWLANSIAWPEEGEAVVAGADGRAGAECHSKTGHVLWVEDVLLRSSWLAALSFVVIVMLVVASVLAAFFQYTLVTRRKGKKGACSLVGKLLCPCCAPSEPRESFGKLQSDDSSTASASGGE